MLNEILDKMVKSTVYSKELLAQIKLWSASIICHLMMLIVLLMLYNDFQVSSLNLTFSTVIVVLITVSGYAIMKPINGNYNEIRMSIKSKMMSRVLLTTINTVIALLFMMALMYLVTLNKDISQVEEMFIVYFIAIVAREIISFKRAPQTYLNNGERVDINPYKSREREKTSETFLYDNKVENNNNEFYYKGE